MGRPYSLDLRERVVNAVEAEGLSRREAAARFSLPARRVGRRHAPRHEKRDPEAGAVLCPALSDRVVARPVSSPRSARAGERPGLHRVKRSYCPGEGLREPRLVDLRPASISEGLTAELHVLEMDMSLSPLWRKPGLAYQSELRL
jgi:hypothetical protein